MRALVPVSVRVRDDRGSLGNKLTVMRGPLPVYINDPVARLRFVKKAMDGLKESKQAVGAATLAAVNELAPPTVLAQASRLNFSTRLFNLIVTNIPGPQVPIYVLGRRLQDLFPIAFLPTGHALAVAIMSYNGQIGYGLLGDYDALPDIDLLVEGLDQSLDQLLEAAQAKTSANGKRRTPRSSNGQRKSRPNGGQRKSRPNGEVSILPGTGSRPKGGPAADMRAKRNRGPRAPRPSADP
jgi:hypothetical protein